MNENEFTELAYNDHRAALLALWAISQKMADAITGLTEVEQARVEAIGTVREQVTALQDTVAGLFEQVNAPAEA
ncbi:hypothetical protein [Massilia sp. Leaf139]|uniref:hypothetical protein n=1 Tax=Massilia sp. Leaf139 TaxID=1736272 RepID=UPI0006FB817F|nr:hypothetical protein [Massilia sp. Leaf139]KQQ97428.1 hypothetical protein ASF77_05655 [Massilia sp. Leaf139]